MSATLRKYHASWYHVKIRYMSVQKLSHHLCLQCLKLTLKSKFIDFTMVDHFPKPTPIVVSLNRHRDGNYVRLLNQACSTPAPPSHYSSIGMTSSQSSASDLVTIDQAQQIVRAHLSGHDQCIVKSLSKIENKGYRQVRYGLSI